MIKIAKLKVTVAFLLIVSIIFSGCSMQLSFEDSDTDTEIEQTDTEDENKSARQSRVSIIQYIDYSSLNECCEGIKSSLDSAGIGYDVTVCNYETATEECEKLARNIEINGLRDLIVVIGTPCAETVCPIVNTAGKTPVVFCAVTDPVGAGIVKNLKTPELKCTGTATAFNIKEQLNMINTFQPYITRLGVIYTSSEQNTKEQLKSLKKAAKELNITVFDVEVQSPSELTPKAKELMRKVEAVVILPDNMVSKNSWNLTERSIVEKVPLYGVNISQVEEGCVAGYCYDFKALGEKAGEQAVEILHGDNPSEMPVIMERECTLYVNKDRLKELDMEIPEEYKPIAHEVTTKYESKSLNGKQ